MRLLVLVACLVAGLVAASTLSNLNKRMVNPGTGIVVVTGDSGIVSADTAVMASQVTAQAGTPWKCMDTSTNGSIFFCNMLPVPPVYSNAQPVIFVPNVNCVAGPDTLNINALGSRRILKSDGITNLTAGDCTKGLPMLLFFVQSLDGGTGAFLSSK